MIASAAVDTSNDSAACVAELRRRGADRIAYGTWSLLHHLSAVQALLERWQQPAEIALAGLLHTVYWAHADTPPVFGRNERDRVRELVGPAAERLVFLCAEVHRDALLAGLESASPSGPGPLRLRSRVTGEDMLLTPAELGALAVIALASAAERGRMTAAGPGLWLAHATRLAGAARALLVTPPPIFDGCRASVDARAERRAAADYERGWQPPFGASDDIDPFAAVCSALPFVGELLVCRGFRALAAGERDPDEAAARAGRCGATARASLLSWGTSWDKRLALTQWLELAQFLCAVDESPPNERALCVQRIGAICATGALPHALYAQLRSAGVLPYVPPAGSPADALPARFSTYVARFANNHERPLMGMYPGLRARPWHDPAAFPLATALEANAGTIAAEIAALDDSLFHTESEAIARSGAWEVCLLLERGRVNADAAARCPETLAVLRRHGAIDGLAGLAYVSRLAPGSDIAPHRGPTNMRVRCHLGIAVSPDCGLVVDGVRGQWISGRCIVFDDSFEHAAWNHGVTPRVVLIVDVWHPDLSTDEIALLAGLHRYARAHAANLATYWSNNERAAARVRRS